MRTTRLGRYQKLLEVTHVWHEMRDVHAMIVQGIPAELCEGVTHQRGISALGHVKEGEDVQPYFRRERG